MTRVAALPLGIAMLVAGFAACGRTSLELPSQGLHDASARDAAHDAKAPREASVVDSSDGADDGSPLDSGLEDSSAEDSTAAPDAGTDAPPTGPGDASDASDGGGSDASEGGRPFTACDECPLGDQQCSPQVPGQSIMTCVLGDAGCAVWEDDLACRSDVPCCVACMYAFHCPLGSLGDPCQQDTDCAFNACDGIMHVCVAGHCGDHRQDGDESDVDCGGQACNACLTGQRCQSNFDCQGGHICRASHLCE